MESLKYEKLIAPVIAAAMEVHRELGPGLTDVGLRRVSLP